MDAEGDRLKPKKIVLLIDADEQRQSVTRFLLETNGYRVVSASFARAVMTTAWLDCILCYWPCDYPQVERIADRFEAQVVVMVPAQDAIPREATSGQWLMGASCTAANLLNALKIGTARRRGQRPQIQVKGAVA